MYFAATEEIKQSSTMVVDYNPSLFSLYEKDGEIVSAGELKVIETSDGTTCVVHCVAHEDGGAEITCPSCSTITGYKKSCAHEKQAFAFFLDRYKQEADTPRRQIEEFLLKNRVSKKGKRLAHSNNSMLDFFKRATQTKPAFVIGLPGQGKTQLGRQFLKTCRGGMFTLQGGETIDFSTLIGTLAHTYAPTSMDKMMTRFRSGALLKAILTALYLGKEVGILFDELLNYPAETLESLKSCLMPVAMDGIKYYVFTESSRPRLFIETEGIIDGEKKKIVCEMISDIPDIIPSVEVVNGVITIDSASLTPSNQNRLRVSSSYPPSVVINNIAKKGGAFPIDPATAEMISQKRLHESPSEYHIPISLLKIIATANPDTYYKMSDAMRERFIINMLPPMSYDDFKPILIEYGMKHITTHTEKVADIVLDFAKKLITEQHTGVLTSPQTTYNLSGNPKELMLTVSLTPRTITEVLEASKSIEEIPLNFYYRMTTILGFENIPGDEEALHIDIFKNLIQSRLCEPFSEILGKKVTLSPEEEISVEKTSVPRSILDRLPKLQDMKNLDVGKLSRKSASIKIHKS